MTSQEIVALAFRTGVPKQLQQSLLNSDTHGKTSFQFILFLLSARDSQSEEGQERKRTTLGIPAHSARDSQSW